MKTLLVGACLLLVVVVNNQYAAGREMSPAVRRKAIEKILQTRFTRALVKVAKKRAHDAATAKSSPIARALVDRSSSRYNRDIYQETFGGYSRQEVTAFFEEFCEVDVNEPLEENPSPVKPEHINEGSSNLLQYVEDLTNELMAHKPLGDQIKNFAQNNDMSDPNNRDQLDELMIQFLAQVAEQENTVTEEGLCALHGVVSLIFRFIEMGSEGFAGGEEWEDCYYSAMTFWGFLDAYDYNYNWIAWDAMQDNVHIMKDMTRAVAADVKCMTRQLKTLKEILKEGETLDGSTTDTDARDGTTVIFYIYLNLIYEWETLRATINEFGIFGNTIEEIIEEWCGNDSDSGSTTLSPGGSTAWDSGSTTPSPGGSTAWDSGSTTTSIYSSTTGWYFKRSATRKEVINQLEALLRREMLAKES